MLKHEQYNQTLYIWICWAPGKTIGESMHRIGLKSTMAGIWYESMAWKEIYDTPNVSKPNK